MASKSKMIDLGSRPSVAKPEPAKADKNPVYYPSFHISSDSEIPFPKKAFHAKVKLHVKSSEKRTDERGKSRHSYEIAVHGVHPDMEDAEDKLDKGADEATEDAAEALMKSMDRARNKKAADTKSED